MRTTLRSLFFKLSVVACALTVGLVQSNQAHDLPLAGFPASSTSDCLGTYDLPPARYEKNFSLPAVCPRQKNATCEQSLAPQHLPQQIGLRASALANRLAIPVAKLTQWSKLSSIAGATSEATIKALEWLASQPFPVQNPSQLLDEVEPVDVAAEKSFGHNWSPPSPEVYQPYDLSLRDWHYGRFTYRGLARTRLEDLANVEVVRAEVEHPSEIQTLRNDPHVIDELARDAFTAALTKLADAHCLMANEMYQLSVPRSLGKRMAMAVVRSNRATGEALIAIGRTVPNSQSQPYFRAPVFVFFELDGKQLAIPTETAMAWVPDRLPDLSGIQVGIDTIAEEAKISLIQAASKNLLSLGKGLIKISDSLASYSEKRIANREAAEVR